jgi:hypothetical protein
MHTSLRVIGGLSDPMVSVVVGFGFCWWASVEAVHEPAGVVRVRPRMAWLACSPCPGCRG